MFIEIPIENAEEWDCIVKSFHNYEVFYLNSYARAFRHWDEGIPILLYYENESVRAINVIFKRDIADLQYYHNYLPKNTYYDISSPYGYGGLLLDADATNDEYKRVAKEYEQHCSEKKYISEFVRFNLFTEYHKYYTGKVESKTYNVIRSLDMPLNIIYMDFEHKVRKNLKHANNAGLSIVYTNTAEYHNAFLEIYYSTMNRANATEKYYFKQEFFDIINSMKENIMYFFVFYKEKIISTELVLYGSQNAYSFLGGTNREYFSLRPNDFLKFEIIKWGQKMGLKKFVLGGGYGENDGIFKYKKSFSPNGIVDFYIGKSIFNQREYDKLLSIREKKEVNFDCSSQFFPSYRQ